MDQIFVSIQDSFLHKGGTIKSHAAISRTSINREITFVKNGNNSICKKYFCYDKITIVFY